MGCGSSKTQETQTEYFEIDFLSLDKSKTNNQFNLKKLYSQKFEAKPKLSILSYLSKATDTFIRNIFEEFLADEKKTANETKNFLFIFYFCNSKFPKIKNFEYAKYFLPFEENILHEESKIKKLVIVTMENFLSLGIEKKDFYNELDRIIKVDASNSDFENRKLKLKTDEISIHESDVDEEKIDKELLQGKTIEIFRDLNTDNCDKIISNINTQNISCLVIKNNQFNKIIHFKTLIESLIAKDDLIKFIFSNNQTLTGFDEGWRIIIKLISSTKKLKILNLSLSYVYDKYLDEIFKSLNKKKITSLDLSSNFITSSGAKIIANWLSCNKTLKSLNLEQNTMNEFKRDGSDFIMEAVKIHPRLAYLNLSYMILTGFGEKMASALKRSKSLKTLKIRNTRMNLDDHQFLFSAILENESLESLDIGENTSGIDKSVEYLSKAIENVKKLKELNIEKFGIGKKTQDLFLSSLSKNKSLEKLFLNDNRISLKPLLETLAECKSLKEVNISNRDYEYSFSEKEEIGNFMTEYPQIGITYLAPEKKLNSTRGFALQGSDKKFNSTKGFVLN